MVVLGCALVWVTWSVMSQQSVRDGPTGASQPPIVRRAAL